jgi:hypothetical protein
MSSQKLKNAKIYLLAFTNPFLKDLCKLYKIKGFSNLNKEEIIDLILKSIPKNNFDSFLKDIEDKSLTSIITLVPKYFLKENPTKFDILNFDDKNNKLNLHFKGFRWEINTSIHYLNLQKKKEPLAFEFDCTCEYAKDGGFCSHFWLGLIWAFQKFSIEASRWNKTELPGIFHELKNKINFKSFYKEIPKAEKPGMNSVEEFLKLNLMGKTQFNYKDLEELSIKDILSFVSQSNLKISEEEKIKSRKILLIELIKSQLNIEEFNNKFFVFKKNIRISEAKEIPVDMLNVEWGPPLNCHANLKVHKHEKEQVIDILIENNQIIHNDCHWVYHRQNFCSHLIALFLTLSVINSLKTLEYLKGFKI